MRIKCVFNLNMIFFLVFFVKSCENMIEAFIIKQPNVISPLFNCKSIFTIF